MSGVGGTLVNSSFLVFTCGVIGLSQVFFLGDLCGELFVDGVVGRTKECTDLVSLFPFLESW